MKILLITPLFYENSVLGSVRYILNLCKTLSESNEITVFTTKSKNITYDNLARVEWKNELENEEKIKKILIKRFNVEMPDLYIYKYLFNYINKFVSEQNLARLNKIFQIFSDRLFYNNLGPNSKELEEVLKKDSKNYDLVILNHFPFKIIYTCGKILKDNKVKFFIMPFYHENDFYHRRRFLKKSLKMCDFILELNDYSKKMLSTKYSKPVYNISAYIKKPTIYKEEINPFKLKNNLKNKFVILIVGRKEPGKNYKIIIDSLKYIDDNRVVILFIGEDLDKEEIDSQRVVYLGKTDDKTLSLAYSSSDVLVHMSSNESLGLIFLEAWSYGIPVIGNINCNPVKSLINEGVDGYLSNNSKDLAEKINFLKDNPKVREKLGLNGKKRTQKEFSKKFFKERLKNILSEI